MRNIFLVIVGAGFGLLAAAGVFTVFVAVGIVPRFAGRTHTADKVVLYEEMVIFGSIAGGVLSLFPEYCQWGSFLRGHFPAQAEGWIVLGGLAQGVFGLFSGMFIGCLALAIAEMLDSIPIFTRRISFRHGLGAAVLSMAAGKLCGSVFYFLTELHRTVE